MAFRRRVAALLGVGLVALSSPVVGAGPAGAAPPSPTIVALMGNTLNSYTASAPGAITNSITIVGLAGGDPLEAIEFRPSTGVLYGLSAAGRLYSIPLLTGIVQLLGFVAPVPSGTGIDLASNAVTDRLRMLTSGDQNVVIDVTAGAPASTPGTTLTGNPNIAAAAYTNEFTTASGAALFGIDSGTDNLVSINETSGAVAAIGALGVDTTDVAGLDFQPATGTLFAAMNAAAATNSQLYTVNTGSGAATLVGTFVGPAPVRDIAVLPPGRVSFGAATLNSGEAIGTLQVPVVRTAGQEGVVTVHYATTDGSAKAGLDYTNTNGTLSFPDGGFATTTNISVPILVDSLVEGAETFTLTLDTITGGASLVPPTTVTITIADAQVGTLYAVDQANRLLRFTTNAPGSIIAASNIVGLAAGEQIVDLDFRPVTNDLLAVSSLSKLYKVDVSSALVTPIGSPFTPALAGTAFGIDVDSVTSQVRVVSDADQNLRVDPVSGVAVADTNLAYAVADPNNGVNPAVTDVAYTNAVVGAGTTALFGIDTGTDSLVSLASPSSGVLTTVGALNVDAASNSGFDIVGSTPVAFAALQTPSTGLASGLFRVDLATGQATSAGTIGGGVAVRALAFAPPGRFNLQAPTFAVLENVGNLTLTVTRAVGAPIPESVNFATVASGTALPGADFTFVNGTLTFSGAETTKTFQIPILDDQADEPDETFGVQLSSPTGGATIGQAAATTTIVDNDLMTMFLATTTNHLLSVRTDATSTPLFNHALSGLQGGETLVALDARPASRTLYGLGSTGRLYSINAGTGVVTQVGAPLVLTGTAFGLDTNPVADLLRVVSNTDENVRVNPVTGVPSADTVLAYAAGDPNAAVNPTVTGLGYSGSLPGAAATTAYGIDSGIDALVRLGSVGGTPTAPGTGQLTTIGPLGIDAGSLVGFDLAPFGDIAIAASASTLYRINPATGAASVLGGVPGAATISGLAIAPLGTLTVTPASGTPVSGAAQSVTVTAVGPNGLIDTAFGATPVLTSSDGRFAGGTCGTPANGVSTCTGVVFGDLGSANLTATAAGATGVTNVTVQPVGIEFTTAPASPSKNTATEYITAPKAGVNGASLAGYSANQTLTASGDATPPTATKPCTGATCSFSLTFPTPGARTLTLTDTSTPPLTATKSVTVKRAVALTIKVAKIIYAGETASISGTVTAEDGTKIANTNINISTKLDSEPGFTLLGFVPTDANGAFAFTRTPEFNTTYKAEFAGSATDDVATAAVGQAVRTRIRVDRASFSRGLLHFDGVTFPNKKGSIIALYLRYPDGRGVYFGSPKRLDGNSRFWIDRKLGRGTYAIFIHIGKTLNNLDGNSLTFTLRV